jgi:hypothetical protein
MTFRQTTTNIPAASRRAPAEGLTPRFAAADGLNPTLRLANGLSSERGAGTDGLNYALRPADVRGYACASTGGPVPAGAASGALYAVPPPRTGLGF